MRQILNFKNKAASVLAISRKSLIFMGLVAVAPVVFAWVLVASASLLTAVFVSLAYVCVVLGERFD